MMINNGSITKNISCVVLQYASRLMNSSLECSRNEQTIKMNLPQKKIIIDKLRSMQSLVKY